MPYVGKEPVRGQNRELDDISGSFNGGNTAFTMQVGGINTAAGSANQVFINHYICFMEEMIQMILQG